MWSFEEYIIGWLCYLVSVIALLAVAWRMSRNLPWQLPKECFRLSVAAFLLTPLPVQAGDIYWAPAWIKALLNLIFGSADLAWPVLTTIFIAVLSVLLFYVIVQILIQIYRRQRTSSSPS